MYLNGLDELDQTIVQLLIKNARFSYTDIGKEVGISRVAVKARIQALEKNHLSKDEFILAWLDYKGMPEEKAKYQSLIEPERSYHVG